MRYNDYRDDKDDDHIVPDGGSVRVRMQMMDALQRSVAVGFGTFNARDHQPGYRTALDAGMPPHVRDARARANAAYDAMCARLTNAWRTPGRDADPDSDGAARLRQHPGADEVEAKRRAARQAYVDQLTNAWRTPTGQGDPGCATAIERQGEMWRGGR
jgi:hypothetical protein